MKISKRTRQKKIGYLDDCCGDKPGETLGISAATYSAVIGERLA